MSKITGLFVPSLTGMGETPDYSDVGIDEAVFNNKLKRPEKLREKKRRWRWIKRNCEITYSN